MDNSVLSERIGRVKVEHGIRREKERNAALRVAHARFADEDFSR
jgi:hypothetical protein